MMQFTCPHCSRKWFSPEDIWQESAFCPYCSERLPVINRNTEDRLHDTLEQLFFSILNDRGKDILKNRAAFISLMQDYAPGMKREINIIRNNCDDYVFSKLFDSFGCDPDTVKISTNLICGRLITENGLSEDWARRICEAFCSTICIFGESNLTTLDPSCYKAIPESVEMPPRENSISVDRVESIKQINSVYPEIISSRVPTSSFPQWFYKRTAKRPYISCLIICDENLTTIKSGSYDNFEGWIIIGSGVRKIETGAFKNCRSELIFIPSSVNCIERAAFSFLEDNDRLVVFENNPDREMQDGAFSPVSRLKIAFEERWSHRLHKYCSRNKIQTRYCDSFENYFIALSQYLINEMKS